MRYLADSCIIIFWVSDRERLTDDVQHIINDPQNLIYVSSDTVKELILLLQCDQIRIKQWKTPEDAVDFVVNDMNFAIKPIKEEHLRTFASLPKFRDHKDPFDRMLIAHAMTEKITLISSDTKFSRYEKYGLDFVFNNC